MWHYPIKPSSKKLEINRDVETQQARQFVGLSLAEFDALPGNPEWAKEYRTENQSFSCKADIIIFYRLQKRIESISSEPSR